MNKTRIVIETFYIIVSAILSLAFSLIYDFVLLAVQDRTAAKIIYMLSTIITFIVVHKIIKKAFEGL